MINNKYEILKELISEWLTTAKEDAIEAHQTGGQNCYGLGFAEGEVSAYRQILADIVELETEVASP